MNSKKFKQSLVIAAVGIIGAVLGALMSGYFLLESSRNNTEALINSVSRQHAQEELKTIRNKTDNFVQSLMETLIAIVSETSEEIVSAHIDNLNLQIFSFTLYTEDSLAIKSIKLTQDLNKMAKSKFIDNSSNLDSLRNSFQNNMFDWIQEARSEISGYRYHSMPDKMKSDLKQMIINSILEN